MRTFLALSFVLATACASSPTKSAGPVANTTPSRTWQEQTREFFDRFADAVDVAGVDCEKLAIRLETLAPAAQDLAGALAAAGVKLADQPLEPAIRQRLEKTFARDPELLDRCENQNPRLAAALDATLLTISPLTFGGPATPAEGAAAN